tara:strand:+ start:1280 stop:2161 length:882 start_codon:yes stop_codon:yes gene_type:complete
MGLLDSLGSVLSRVVPTVVGFATGNVPGAVGALAGVEVAKRNEKRMENQMSNFYAGFGEGQVRSTLPPVNTAPPGGNSFFGDLGRSIGDFGRGVGQFFTDIAPATQLFGLNTPQQQMAPQAAKTIIKQAPDESATSGEITGANLGALAPLAGLARQAFRSPAATGLGGGALGFAGSMLAPAMDGKPRITRKMKADVRRIYMMAGMDPNMTAQILNNLGTYPRMNFNASLVFLILTKRFRNDGPVVTKAAVRKTRTTLRRMKGIVDLHNSICKPTTRRAPARRAAPKAVQLIKN